jgi:hypothetical protein
LYASFAVGWTAMPNKQYFIFGPGFSILILKMLGQANYFFVYYLFNMTRQDFNNQKYK